MPLFLQTLKMKDLLGPVREVHFRWTGQAESIQTA